MTSRAWELIVIGNVCVATVCMWINMLTGAWAPLVLVLINIVAGYLADGEALRAAAVDDDPKRR